MNKKLHKAVALILTIGLCIGTVIPYTYAATVKENKETSQDTTILENEDTSIKEESKTDEVKSNDEKSNNEKSDKETAEKSAKPKETDETNIKDSEKPILETVNNATKESKTFGVYAEGKATFNLADWQYAEENGQIIINKYIGTDTDVVLPGTYNGKQIVLGERVFDVNHNVVNVVIGSASDKVQGKTDISYLFNRCNKLERVDLSGLDTSKVTDMSHIFDSCSSLTSIDVSSFDTSNATDMSHMFAGCSSLTSIDVSSFDTSKARSINGIFYNCKKLKTIDVSKWNVSNVYEMGLIFDGCENLKTVDVSKWNTTEAISMTSTFEDCKSLKTVDISNWDTSRVNGFSSMFQGCESLEYIDVSKWDTSSAYSFSSVFEDCKSLKTVDISNWDLSGFNSYPGGPGSMERMFYGCDNMQFFDISAFDSINNFYSYENIFYSENPIPTVIISDNKLIRENGLKGSKRVPYIAKITVNNAEFKDKTQAGKTLMKKSETKTLGTGEIVYSSLEEYKKEFQHTRKEIIDMIVEPTLPEGATSVVWHDENNNEFPPDEQIVDFTIGKLEHLQLTPQFTGKTEPEEPGNPDKTEPGNPDKTIPQNHDKTLNKPAVSTGEIIDIVIIAMIALGAIISMFFLWKMRKSIK